MTLDPIEPDLLWLKIGLIVALMLGIGVGIWRFHHAAYESGLARDADKVTQAEARVRAITATNDANVAVIRTLRAQNMQYAAAAKPSVAQAAQAHSKSQAETRSGATVLTVEQSRLKKVIHAKPETMAWGDARVPDAVADQLRDATDAH